MAVCLILLLGFSLAVADFTKYQDYITQQANNETFVSLFDEHLKLFEDSGQNLKSTDEFHCKPFLRTNVKSPQTVHELTPFDIKVIGALGDSITAGTGIKAKTVIGLLKQDRGSSWSVGGDASVPGTETLPNILKVYNKDITGFSEGWGPVWLKSVSRLNLANPGDKSEDIPGQAVALVERMKCDKNINFEEDWKMITLFIGGNDLCDYCDDKKRYSAENYVAHIQKALDYLHANVPRAYVNLVEVLDIAIVKTLNANLVCKALHLYLCDCAAFPKNDEAEQELVDVTEQYRKQMNDMVLTGRYDTRDDFTVVVQPFFKDTYPPKIDGTDKPDLSYFAPDCFHLSAKGHRAAADALWNNMIEPVGKKRTMWTPGEVVECPTASTPYFYTYKNSGSDSYKGSKGLRAAPQNDAASGTEPEANSGSHAAVAVVVGLATVAVCALVVAFVVYRKNGGWSRKQCKYSAI